MSLPASLNCVSCEESSVRFQVCSPVAGNVSCFDAAGLRKCHPRQYSAVICSSNFSQWWTLLFDWCSHHCCMTTSLHPSANCTDWSLQGSELISSSLSLATSVNMEQHHHILPTNLASWQTVRLDIIYVPPHHHRCSCELSVTGPFVSPQLMFGTVCRSRSHLHHHCLSSAVA